MITSMTGFASGQGTGLGFRWAWELRSVNGKGLDMRLRVPDWIDGLEPAIRTQIAKVAKRGNLSLSLRINRLEGEGGAQLNQQGLQAALQVVADAEAQAARMGIVLSPIRATDLLAMRGVMETGGDSSDTGPLKDALLLELPDLIDAFVQMRRQEGASLQAVLGQQLDEIQSRVNDAGALLETRRDRMSTHLRQNLAKIVETTDVDSARIAQELAIIAVKSDITEELDRLRTHVCAARDLLDEGGAVGRKLDFLMQEFNREANTLCSKAQMSELTEIGLALKVLIDQMREQVQNVE